MNKRATMASLLARIFIRCTILPYSRRQLQTAAVNSPPSEVYNSIVVLTNNSRNRIRQSLIAGLFSHRYHLNFPLVSRLTQKSTVYINLEFLLLLGTNY